MKDKKLQICNSTVEFLVFTSQAGEDSIEVRVADETVWLTRKLMAELFDVTNPTINEHLANIYAQETSWDFIRSDLSIKLNGLSKEAEGIRHLFHRRIAFSPQNLRSSAQSADKQKTDSITSTSIRLR